MVVDQLNNKVLNHYICGDCVLLLLDETVTLSSLRHLSAADLPMISYFSSVTHDGFFFYFGKDHFSPGLLNNDYFSEFFSFFSFVIGIQLNRETSDVKNPAPLFYFDYNFNQLLKHTNIFQLIHNRNKYIPTNSQPKQIYSN